MMEILIGPKRTIWDDHDDELVGITRKYAAKHHDLIPYTRSYLFGATRNGMPVMRPLIFAYPGETNFSDTWDEYLYGEDLLVAPVTTLGATSRSVGLPAGKWLDYNDRKTVYEGGKSARVAAALGTIPVFVREGGIVPRGDIVKLNNNWDAHWKAKLRIEIFPAEKTASEFAYFTGITVQKIRVEPSKAGVKIEFGDLGVGGVGDLLPESEGRDHEWSETARGERVCV
jgi:alpha-D-xyloside xylohydrolase